MSGFDDSFYHALAALKEHLRKYQRLVLLFPEDIKHPRSSCQYFNCFCQDYHIDSAIVEIQTGYKSAKEKCTLQSVR